MRNQSRQSARGNSISDAASRATPQNTLQSESWPSRKPYLLLLLILLVASPSSASHAVRQAGDDGRTRRIDSTDFTNSRKAGVARRTKSKSGSATKPRSTYRLTSGPTAGPRALPAGNFMQLGITVWRLRLARKDDSDRRALIREKGKGRVWAAERVASDAIIREGDYVRLSVESPRRGYLYVIDRDLSADGTTGPPMLIFPWSGADNILAPGRLIDIPRQDDDPNFLTASLTRQNQVGELLTFIVTNTPLKLPVSDDPLPIAAGDLNEWEKSLGGVTERYEMEGGAGEVWTVKEQQAAGKNHARQLTREDPAPQNIYRVFTENKKGMLVNLALKYAK